MNLQTAFNTINFGAWKQGARSKRPDGCCVYRNKANDRRCFVGMLLTDPQIDEIEEEGRDSDTVRSIMQVKSVNNSLCEIGIEKLLYLQRIHDKNITDKKTGVTSEGIPLWQDTLRQFAERHLLKFTPWSTFEAQKFENEEQVQPVESTPLELVNV